MSNRHCEECGAVLDPAKVLRCTKCKACFYCSRACQKRNWKLHKRVCSTDPALRPYVPVEMAVERALAKAKEPKIQAPKDVFCYICLEGEDGGKLMRGCACRGDSAGFVHLECLTELAMSKEASGDHEAAFYSWIKCGNCKQSFQGALELEMNRRFWRRYRSSQDMNLHFNSTKSLACCLGNHGEFDVANQLLDAASTCVGNNKKALVELKVYRANFLLKSGQKLQALGLLQAMLPEAKVYTAHPHLYGKLVQDMTSVLLGLDRNQEAHEAAAEAVAFAKAKFGLEHQLTLQTRSMYAVACAKLGLVEEAKTNFKDAITTQTRVLGPDHFDTQLTARNMCSLGFAEPSGVGTAMHQSTVGIQVAGRFRSSSQDHYPDSATS